MSYFLGSGESKFRQPAHQVMQVAPSPSSDKTESPSAIIARANRLTVYYPLVFGLFGLFFGIFLLFEERDPQLMQQTHATLRSLNDLCMAFGSAVAVIGCFCTAWRLRQHQSRLPLLLGSRGWLAWTLVGVAAVLFTVGKLTGIWYEWNSTSMPFPALSDLCFLLAYPFSLAGLVMLLPAWGTVANRTSVILDAGTAAAAAVAISWYFLFVPILGMLNGSELTRLVALGYPFGDLSLCAVAVLLLFSSSSHPALNGMLVRLGLGVAILAVTDSLYVYDQIHRIYHTSMFLNLGWPVSWLFICWAALIYPGSLTRATSQMLKESRPHLSRLGASTRALIPLLIVLLTCILLIVGVTLRDSAPLVQVVIVCIVLFLLSVIRQALTLVENIFLNERLRVALSQAQQAFLSSQQELMATASRAEQFDELRAGIKDLQEVHAALARGDYRVRATVEGPLSQIALSLNLLVERMNSWEHLAQTNTTLEAEVFQVRQLLEHLCEGRLVANIPQAWSGSQNGGAMAVALHLQQQLTAHYEQLRIQQEKLERLNQENIQILQRLRPTLKENLKTDRELRLIQEALLHLERRVTGNRLLLHDLKQQLALFDPHLVDTRAGRNRESN